MSQAHPDEIISSSPTFPGVPGALNLLKNEIGLSLDLEEILEKGLAVIMQATRAEVGEVFLIEAESLEKEGQFSFHRKALKSSLEFQKAFNNRSTYNYGEDYPGWLVQNEAATLFCRNLISDERFTREGIKNSGLQTALAFPLQAEKKLVAILGLFFRENVLEVSLPNLEPIEELTLNFGVAINNAINFQSLKQIRSGMHSLFNAIEIVNSSLNPRHVLVRLLSEAVRLTKAEGGAIYLFSPWDEEMKPHATILIDPEWRERCLKVEGSLASEVFQTRTIRAVADTATTPETIFPFLEEHGRPRAVIAAPLTRKAHLRGVLECYSSRPRRFNKNQMELLSAIASHAVLALRNAELHHELQKERRHAEVEHQKLRMILDKSPEGFFFARPEGQIVDFNQSARDILRLGDFTPSNYWGFPRDYQIFRPDGITLLDGEVAMARALRDRAVIVVQEAIFRWPDGIEKYLLLSAAPIYDQEGEMLGALSLFQDVTELKKAEKLKSKFLSMITHELKTPLASIKGTVSGLLQEDVEWDTLTQNRFLHSIENDVDGMVSLVGNLLDMARLEAGFMQPDLEECYLIEVVEEASRKLRTLAKAANQQIIFAFAPKIPPVLADFSQMERVLINIIGNALKYSPGETDINISVRVLDHPTQVRQVEIAVGDRGPGILPEERDLIFKQFYRGQKMAGRAGRKVGTGLGLAICKEIIALHNGLIRVEDRPGGGSIFKIGLPAI